MYKQLASAEDRNQNLILELETVQQALQSEITDIKTAPKREADGLKQEIMKLKEEQNKMQQEVNALLQEWAPDGINEDKTWTSMSKLEPIQDSEKEGGRWHVMFNFRWILMLKILL